MVKTIDYYICLISPYTYLGDGQLRKIAEKHGAEINFKPINLGLIFPETGGLPLAKRAPARQAYRMQELERWRDFLNVDLNTTPKYFPTNEWPAAGMVISAKQQGLDCGPLVNAFLSAVWAHELDISDQETIITIANDNGFDGPALFEAASQSEMLETWNRYSEEALESGVFGAPTYIYNGQVFWGQDRLDFLDRALGA
jgi:2-hydroxychromene-2-carboxylate isomerase